MMSPHILFLPSWYPEKAKPTHGTFFQSQAESLVPATAKMGVLALNFTSILDVEKPKKDVFFRIENGVRVYRKYFKNILPKIPYGHSSLYLYYGMRFFKEYVEKEGVPDLVHAHNCLYGGLLAQKIKSEFGVPFVVTEHSTDFRRHVLPKWKIGLVKSVLKATDTLIVCSWCQGDELAKLVPGDKLDYVEIPNTLDEILVTNFQETKLGGTKVRKLLNIAEYKEKKGQFDLLEAMKHLDSSVHLKMVGSGPLEESLKIHAKKLGVADRVEVSPRASRKEILKFLAESDLLVISSHDETFCVAVIEALSQGVPAVATRSGGPECILTEDILGELVDPKDPLGLASAITNQLSRELTQVEAKKIREIALNRYAPTVVGRQLLDLYKSVIGEKKARG